MAYVCVRHPSVHCNAYFLLLGKLLLRLNWHVLQDVVTIITLG
jgi:hypothetical protein